MEPWERWMQCGKPACRCYTDPGAGHGPYYQWRWAEGGETRSIYLGADQVELRLESNGNNRELELSLKRMRAVSLHAARRHQIDRKGIRQ